MRTEDKERYELQLQGMKEQRDESLAERKRWEQETSAANEQIRQLTIAQQSANAKERARLEARIQQVEANKQSKSLAFMNILGNVLGMGLPSLLGAIMGQNSGSLSF